jgi:hypothetical protein
MIIKLEVLRLCEDCEQGKRDLILAYGVLVRKFDVFVNFVNYFHENFLTHHRYELVVEQHVL